MPYVGGGNTTYREDGRFAYNRVAVITLIEFLDVLRIYECDVQYQDVMQSAKAINKSS